MGAKLLSVIVCDHYGCESKEQVTADVGLCREGVEISPDMPEGWTRRWERGYGGQGGDEYSCPRHAEKR